MAKKSDSGDQGPEPSARNPFPIAVPRGGKHPPPSRIPRWIRDYVASSSSDLPASGDGYSQPPPFRASKPGDPVQRATTQMLPGRLEPLNPSILQQEIRFLRTASEVQVVTLGWNIGDPPDHVTLNHSSIQPLHARMTYRDGGWWIESLAHQDPVAVNRDVLPVSSPPRLLVDGDRISLGAVVFRFYFP